MLALTICPPSWVGPRFFLFLLRLALVLDPAGGSDFLKSPGDVAPQIGLLGDFVSITNNATVWQTLQHMWQARRKKSRRQCFTGSMVPVHRRTLGMSAWVRSHKDATTDQTSDHGKCQMTQGMTSPRHEELTCPAKSLHSNRVQSIACSTQGER